MSLTARPRPVQGQDIVAGGTHASLNIAWPDTPARWARWQRRREQMRIDIGRWAIGRAKACALAGTEREEFAIVEFLAVLDRLQLRRADDVRLRAEHTRRPAKIPANRALDAMGRRKG